MYKRQVQYYPPCLCVHTCVPSRSSKYLSLDNLADGLEFLRQNGLKMCIRDRTTGEVEVNGVISALLELGAGFNMDYTGIENIYMNGTMMGFSKKEMDAKLQEILDFADIGDFVYQPVKTYSSGMFVRLAFALAINVEPEILLSLIHI